MKPLSDYTQEEIKKFVEGMTEQIKCRFLFYLIHPNGCWHEWERKGEYEGEDEWHIFVCQKCKKESSEINVVFGFGNPNHYTKEGFWEVWEWLGVQKWVEQFHFQIRLIDYSTFPDILISFLLDNVEDWGWVECSEYYPDPDSDFIHSPSCLIKCNKRNICNSVGKLKTLPLLYIESLEVKDAI